MAASRVRLTAVAALVAAAVLAAVLVFAGGADGDASTLAWGDDVQLIAAERSTDHILYGKVDNTSLRDVELDVTQVEVRDAEGREVRSALRFAAAFAHGLYPWSQAPKPLGDFERRRLGQIVKIKAGGSAPITLSWRVPEGGAPAERVDFGAYDLALPKVAEKPVTPGR